MTLLIKDRVKEITTSVGTGPIVVGTSLVTGFQSIASAIGDGNTAPYVIEVQGGADWEIGIGQYVSSNTSLLRLQVLASSNSNNLVNFSAGAKNVFVTLPAAYAGLTARDLSQFSATTSAQLASIITDETGTGKLVFSDNAVLVAPDIGSANGTTLTLSGDLNVSGNIYLAGNTTTLNSNNLSIADSLIYLAANNAGNLNDIGIVGNFTSTKYQHTGFVRDATDGVWKLFSNVSAEPTTTIDFSTDVIYDSLRVGSVTATTFNGALFGNANTVTNGIYSTDTGTVTNTMLSGGISNAKLSNSSITVSPGTGLNGGGTVALGSSVTLNANSGSTSAAGILQLNDTISSTSTTLAATANAAKTAYDLATTANTNASNASVLTTGTVPNARLVSIPNSSLANSSVTVGTTIIPLGSSNTTLTGLTAVNSTSFVGALTGNADTATKLQTARQISLIGGVLGTATSFDGSINIQIPVTQVNSANLSGTISNTLLVSVPNSSLANSSVTVSPGTGLNGGGTVALGSSVTLNANTGSTSAAGILQLTDSISSTSTTTAATPNSVKTAYDLATTANTNASNASNLTTGTLPNARLNAVPNIALANSSITVTPGTGLNGGGTVALGSSVTLNANTGSTSAAGILQLTDSISSTSTTTAATANSVKTAYDLAVTANTNASNASVLTTGTVPNARLVSIPNSSLANSSITIGTTAIPLGSSNTTLVGLTSVNSTSFVGALTGNADTATKLQTARTIALSGAATGTATSFDGSGNITIPVTTLASANLSGTISNTLLASIPNSSLANTSVTLTPGTGLNGGGAVALGSSITLNANSGSTSAAGILQLNDTVSSTSTALAATANSVNTVYNFVTTVNTNASNASNLTTGTLPNARLVSIPNSSLANTSVTVTPGTGLNGGGTVALGSSITLNANSGSTTAAGILQLNDTVTSTSTTLAATANAAKTAYDLATTANTNASNASVLTTGTVPNARLVSIPNSSLANTSVTVTPGTGLNGGGAVALGSSITVNANTGSTSVAGILQLNDTVTSTSTALAATANAAKTAYDLATTANTNASNASVLTTGTVPNARLVSIPNSSLANTSVTVTPGTGLNGGGAVALGSSITVNANTGSTSAAGILQLNDTVSSTSTTLAATANSVNTVYNFATTVNTNASNASNLTTGTLPNARLSAVPNSALANSSVTVTPGTGLNGGGAVALGSSVTLNANNGSTSAAGILQLNDTISSTSTTLAATANSVNTVYSFATTVNTNASNASNLTTGTLPNARLVSIPNSSLANTSVTVTPGTGLNGGGAVALGSSITVNANTGSTSAAGILQLNDTVSSTSTTLAATANSVKTAYDLATTANTNASNASVLTTGTLPNARLVSIPNSSLANTSVTVTPGTGLNGGGTVALGSSITVNANTGSTTAAGILQLNDTVTSTSTTLAATANAAKTAYDLATTANTNASNASNLTTGTLPNARLVSIPNSSLANTSVTVTPGTGLNGGGAVALGSSITVNANTGSTTAAGILQLNDTISSTSTTLAATANAAKTAYDLATTANTNASNASNLTTGTLPNARLVSIPNSSLANTSVTVTPGTGLSGGGTVALGSTITLNANTGSTSAAGILQLTDSVSSTSTTTAATPNSVTNVYNFANSAYNKANTAIYTAPGTTGNVLTSNGTAWVSSAPTGGGGGVTSFSAGTTGFSPSTGTAGAVTLSGTLNLINGGTQAALTAVSGGVVYSGASAMAITAAGTANQIFVSTGTTAPTFTNFDLSIHASDSSYKKLARVATVGANITVAGSAPNTLDGITLALGDRILVKDQTAPAENGIYYVSTLGTGANGTWTRAIDADVATDVDGATVAVGEGTLNGGKRFQTTWKSTDTLNTTAMYWNKLVDVLNSSTAPLQTTAVGLDIATPTDTVTLATGAVTDLVLNSFGSRTLAAVAASTYTRASTVYIAGAPTAGTNATITNSYALYVASGTIQSAATITGASNVGAYSYGNLSYTDSNIFASYTSSINNYNQLVIQNTNAGAAASVDITVSNNLGTASTFYGNFGMNSSVFTGTGSFSLANAVYLSATSGDLVLGTTTTNNIRFVINSGATDAVTINTSGAIAANGSYGTAGQVLTTQGSGSPPTWTTVTGGGGGLTTTDDNATNATYYPVFVTTAGGSTAKTGSTGLQYNPSVGTLSATIFNSLSDQSKKTNVSLINDAVDTINKIDGVEFDWKENGNKSAGVIAQQLEEILPHLVNTDDEGLKSVNYSGIIGYLIQSVKELSARVQELENK